MRDYCIHTWFGFELPLEDRVRLIKEAGFSSVMLWWSDEHQQPGANKENHPDIIRKLGLHIENVHLPFSYANNIWLDNLNGELAFSMYSKCIEDSRRHDFPIAVMHPNRSVNPPPVNAMGLDRLRRLSEKAAQADTVLALENVSKWNYTDSILTEIDLPALGFCYDCGHDLLYSSKPYELPLKFADRLVAVHLHDNMMENDDHMLPTEGMINLPALLHSINESGYKGPMSLEVTNPKPGEGPVDYLNRAYIIAKMLEAQRHNY